MNVQHFPAFAFCIPIFFTVVCFAQVSDKRFCGLQHTDDYLREQNGTSINEFPWLAALIYKFNSDGAKAVLCTGALINRRYILTAAQCLTHPQASVLVAVRLGEYHIKNETDCVISRQLVEDCTTATDYGVEEKIVHPQYNRQIRANDIALIRIDKTVNEFTDFIRPICVLPPNDPAYAKIGDTLHASGWGRQLYNSEPAQIKKKVNTTLITNEQCAGEFTGRSITENNICTRDLITNTEFTCHGDAGAPVMFVSGGVPQWHVEGVVSWGGQCGVKLPQVHTRVSNYIDWIEKNIRD